MTSRDLTFAAAGAGGAVEYVDDVFSTFLYTGNGSTQTITNGIDLAGKGGMTWMKSRSTATPSNIYDTNRGNNRLISNSDVNERSFSPNGLTSFNSNGFTIAKDGFDDNNVNGTTYCSWTFREAPKFFDVVTYTGNGTNRTIAHNLGSVPGMIIVKRTGTTGAWQVYHRSLANTEYLVLNTTAAKATGATRWNSTTPTSTVFSLGTDATVNASGSTYVAYLFAHNDGGFGAAGTDNIISCGSFTTDGSGNTPQVNLGFEPQYILYKRSSSTGSWAILDNMRGLNLTSSAGELVANIADAEGDGARLKVNATGFYDDAGGLSASATHIYMAIRRPMKPPTSGTQVFAPVAYTGNNTDNRLVDTGIVTDMAMARIRTISSSGGFHTADRLRGNAFISTQAQTAETTDADSYMTPTVGFGNAFSAMNGFGVGNDATRLLNQSSTSQLAYAFQRRPTFFDVVCYTGTGSNRTVAHNLGVAPELMIVKRRNAGSWAVYSNNDPLKYLLLNYNDSPAADSAYWNNTNPTSSVFTVGGGSGTNESGVAYVAYLFATCVGVSKVGSYTGTGITQTINCGFTGGARFVMIKKFGIGDWYVWDTARGIVSGNDPYLFFNEVGSEVTNTDFIDPVSSGFELSSTAPSAINANGDSFIYLAIA